MQFTSNNVTRTAPICLFSLHYCDVMMCAMASQITSLTIVYSTVHSGADQRKHQSSASLAFVRGIHRSPVNSPHKWPVTRKMLPFDDVIMRNQGIMAWWSQVELTTMSAFGASWGTPQSSHMAGDSRLKLNPRHSWGFAVHMTLHSRTDSMPPVTVTSAFWRIPSRFKNRRDIIRSGNMNTPFCKQLSHDIHQLLCMSRLSP